MTDEMKASLRIVTIYIVTASLWIVLSDKAISFVADDIQALTWFATAKGLAFVAVTATLLFHLIRRELGAKNAVIEELKTSIRHREELANELHHRIKNNLQVVKSLISLEAEAEERKDVLVATVLDDIQSISAVFEIVYENRSMSNIPLDEAVRRFVAQKRSGISKLEIEADIRTGIDYRIETMTSIILLLNVVIDSAGKNGINAPRMRITASDPKRIELSCTNVRCDDCLNLISKNQLAEIYLRSFDGRMSTSNGRIMIDIGNGPE